MSKTAHKHPLGLSFGLFLAAALTLLVVGCGEDKEGPSQLPELVSVPEPLLDPVGPVVRRQIRSLQEEIESLRQDPVTDPSRLAASYGELGLAYHAYELIDGAEACYENARRLDPNHSLWAYAAGRLARDQRGDLGAAIKAFEAAAEAQEEEAEEASAKDPIAARSLRNAVFLHLGHTYLDQGELKKAEAVFHKVLAANDSSAAAHDGLGRVAVAAKDPERAAGHFRQALESQPRASRVAYRLGQALRRAGHLEEAKAALEGQGGQEVSFPDPFEILLAAAGTGTAALLRQGGQAQLAGRFDIAEDFYRQAVEASPEDAAARLSLGAALTHRGDVAGAVEHYQIAARLQPGNPVPAYNLGHLRIRQGDLDAAAQQFGTALELEPGHLEARLGLASVAERRQAFADALSLYGAILRDHPGNLQARSRRAVVLASSGRQQEALEELRAIVATAPNEAEPWLHLGTLLAQLGRMDEAREALVTALEKDLPPEAKTRAEGFLERIDGGNRLYPESASQGPATATAAATSLILSGRSVEARKILEDALPKAPGNPQLALTLARILAAAPDPKARDGRRALGLAQAIHRVLDSLESGEAVAMALGELGRFDEAVLWQEKLVAEAERAGDATLIVRLRPDLERYRTGEPCANPWAR